MSQDVKLENGAVRKVYSIDGKLVHSLDDITNDSLYVISNGEPYKKAYYHVKDGDVEMDVKDEEGNYIPGRIVMKKRDSRNSKLYDPKSSIASTTAVEKGIFTSTASFFINNRPKAIVLLCSKTVNLIDQEPLLYWTIKTANPTTK